eukprot:CAMPEP_0171299158 /NCGR_PEP_ID=MMETSP0816-20121228/7948_1 /TAXON_ID=420281 /ORGANISM="Proboscia inermis, Strain CCAP1064/1" /LENGTH=333 /DNA_ID=CAMNT_0011774713 /DNA_START=156 /DNA_END=1158 /DNA_ORIENTATION=+
MDSKLFADNALDKAQRCDHFQDRAHLHRSVRTISGTVGKVLSDYEDKGNKSDNHRLRILSNALNHVEEYGWTEDALAAGVSSSNLPLSMVGLVKGKSTELVSFFMDKCNDELKQNLQTKAKDWDSKGFSVADRIRESIWMRLELISPFVRNKRWHEAMAIGAIPPYNSVATAYQLEQMVSVIAENGCQINMGRIEKLAIGAVYIAAELHMLSDDSENFSATREFLNSRVCELELIADNGAGAVLSGDSVIAASAVVTSLGGAIFSIAEPSFRNVTSVTPLSMLTQLTTLLNQDINTVQKFSKSEPKSSVINLDDLPPFETNVTSSNASDKSPN